MILGFAHLMINVSDIETSEAFWENRGYERGSYHKSVLNHAEKSRFIEVHPDEHDLLLLQSENGLSIELTYHGPTDGENSLIEVESDTVVIGCADIDMERTFFTDALGFAPDGDENFLLNSRFAAWRCNAKFKTSNAAAPQLDRVGPTGLAFYVRRISDMKTALIEAGATEATEIFELTLADKDMRIVMMRSPGGCLIELIEIVLKR